MIWLNEIVRAKFVASALDCKEVQKIKLLQIELVYSWVFRNTDLNKLCN